MPESNESTLAGSDQGDVASDLTRYQTFATPWETPDEIESQDKHSSQQNPSTSNQDLIDPARAAFDVHDLKRQVDELTLALASNNNLLKELVSERRSSRDQPQQTVERSASGHHRIDVDPPTGPAPRSRSGDIATHHDQRNICFKGLGHQPNFGSSEDIPVEEPLNSTRISVGRDVSIPHQVPINQIDPLKFNGDPSKARAWLKEYESAMEINGYPDEYKLKRVSAFLTDDGATFYETEEFVHPEMDWTSFKNEFLENFCGVNAAEQIRKRIDNSYQTSDKAPVIYARHILGLCMQLERLTGVNMTESELVTKVTAGLTREVRNLLSFSRPPHTWTLSFILRSLKAFIPPTNDPQTSETSRNDSGTKQAPAIIKQGETPRRQRLQPRDLATWLCFNCNNKGHVIADCKEPRNETLIKERSEKFRQEKQTRQVNKIGTDRHCKQSPNLPCDDIAKPLLTVDINGRKIQGLVDSGADMTVSPSDVATDLKLRISKWTGPNLLSADKSDLNILGMTSMTVTYENKVRPILAAVLPRTSLARPLWGGDFLHAFSIKMEFKEDLNPTISTVSARDNHPIDQVQFGDLDVAGRNLFEETLLKFGDTFSRTEQDIGRTSTVKHRIILVDDKPVHKPPYRIPHRLRDTMQAAIDKLKATGAIRELQSPFASPVFFVDKDHGMGKRLVADYRALNAKTIPDRTPMPHPEDVFGMLANMNIFAKLDITSMFNQIEVDERDIEKTAISTPFGLYECPLMSFGLINAPATAVRLMKTVLRGLDGKIAYVYFDDIIVFAEDSPKTRRNLCNVAPRC